MPPKARTTKEDIINAGFELVRRSGYEGLNVRAVAAALNCSTQPIMYHYAAIEDLKSDIYAAADNFHTEYIMNVGDSVSPALTVGLNYIRFASEEAPLFRFLFQSERFRNTSLDELISGNDSHPVIRAIARRTGLSAEQSKRLFETLFFCAHGISVLIADGSVEYDEKYCENMILTMFKAAVVYMKGREAE